MERFTLPYAIVVMLVGLSVASGPAQGADPSTSQAAAMALMAPGPQHAALVKAVGKFTVTGKVWMDPSAAPTPTTGTAEFSMIMDGRFLRQDYSGEMKKMPFAGLGIDGYDNVLKKYTSFWCDSMATGSMNLIGDSTDGGKTVTYAGDISCPMTGGTIKCRCVLTRTNDDLFTFEMYNTMNGKEAKGMELVYTRVK